MAAEPAVTFSDAEIVVQVTPGDTVVAFTSGGGMAGMTTQWRTAVDNDVIVHLDRALVRTGDSSRFVDITAGTFIQFQSYSGSGQPVVKTREDLPAGSL